MREEFWILENCIALAVGWVGKKVAFTMVLFRTQDIGADDMP